MAYAEVRTDLMHGTHEPADLVSVKYQESSTYKPIENGNVVVVGGLISGQREVRKASAMTATSKVSELALIATPETIYDDTPRKTYADFRNEAGEISRGYRLKSGDIFSVTIGAISGRTSFSAVTVGDIVEVAAGTKLNVAATATQDTTTVGKVIDKENGKWIVIQID